MQSRKETINADLHLALVHYPVTNKKGDIIASAVTNLDLHDIARAGATYGVRAVYIVTPLKDQKALLKRILAHWAKGFGAAYNPKRAQALKLIRVVDTLQDARDAVAGNHRAAATRVVATSSREQRKSVSFRRMRALVRSGDPHLLVLGTAWGLAAEVIASADYLLEPVRGTTAYNHLSVRCAAAIILDRLLA